MRTLDQLLQAHCQPLSSGAMTDAELEGQLRVLPDWRFERGAITRTFRFADYHVTLAFVNALAWVAHAEDHHPELIVGYNRCEVRFSTHSVGGITRNDFICAAKADALYAQRVIAAAA